jgi:SAM-dependent methyltransferase
MTTLTHDRRTYMLGTTTAEHDRLIRQGRLISKITRHFLEEIRLLPGMRVLDVGCGVGDVALMAAQVVAPDGEVVGIDLDESALRLASERAGNVQLQNVKFHTCNLRDFATGDLFDAAVGRCVLLHQTDPAAALAAVARHVRPGGIVGFQEPWFSQGFSFPKMPLFEEVIGWLHSSVKASSLDGDIGLRLASIFASAGLVAPKLSFEMLMDCSSDEDIWQFVTDTVRSLLPRLENLGIASAARAHLETLPDRLRREQAELASVVGIMPLVGAWCRKASGLV